MASSPAALIYDRRRHEAVRRGIWLPRQPVGPVAQHVDTLMAAGMRQPDIAAAARVSTSTVKSIGARRRPTVHGHTAKAILGVTPALPPKLRPGKWTPPA
jgi:hypothetical protein